MFLREYQYSFGSSLLWGNCIAHAQAFLEEAECGLRAFVHLLWTALEALPLIGQIISLVEQLLAWIYYSFYPPVRFDDNRRYDSESPTHPKHNPNRSILKRTELPIHPEAHTNQPVCIPVKPNKKKLPADIAFVNPKDYVPASDNLTTQQKRRLLQAIGQPIHTATGATIAIERSSHWRKFIIHVKPLSADQRSYEVVEETPAHYTICTLIREAMASAH